MSNTPTVEADIVHNLPADLAELIGRVILAYSRLEHELTGLSYLLLQLNKAEARVALRMPRAVDRLDMALDILAIKALLPNLDTTNLRTKIELCTTLRDQLAHGLFLRHPETNDLFLRLSRGSWPKALSGQERVKRGVFPQSIKYNVKDCQSALDTIEETRALTEQLGLEIDGTLESFPERFRPPAPNLNPHGRRKPKAIPAPHGSSGGK